MQKYLVATLMTQQFYRFWKRIFIPRNFSWSCWFPLEAVLTQLPYIMFSFDMPQLKPISQRFHNWHCGPYISLGAGLFCECSMFCIIFGFYSLNDSHTSLLSFDNQEYKNIVKYPLDSKIMMFQNLWLRYRHIPSLQFSQMLYLHKNNVNCIFKQF